MIPRNGDQRAAPALTVACAPQAAAAALGLAPSGNYIIGGGALVGYGAHPSAEAAMMAAHRAAAVRPPLRVIHLGGSACHAISGRGGWSSRILSAVFSPASHLLLTFQYLFVWVGPSSARPCACLLQDLVHACLQTPVQSRMGTAAGRAGNNLKGCRILTRKVAQAKARIWP